MMFILKILYNTVIIEYIVDVRVKLVTVCDLLLTQALRSSFHGGQCISKVKSSV